MANNRKVSFIGLGEAAGAIAEGWSAGGATDILAFDVKVLNEVDRPTFLKRSAALFVQMCEANEQAVRGRDYIFSLVTADSAFEAAEVTTRSIKKGAFYFDCNSCAPGTKRRSAEVIEAAGGRYVDVAVMAPIYPAMHRSPVSVCGPHADAAIEAMLDLDMVPTKVDGEVGAASSIKMVRSIMMKGLEALMVECILAGREAGVDDAVLDSLEKTYPGFGWKERAAYMLERVMVHGQRRAAEMREVAITVDELGLQGRMSKATVGWHQEIGDLRLDPAEDDYRDRADRILHAIKNNEAN